MSGLEVEPTTSTPSYPTAELIPKSAAAQNPVPCTPFKKAIRRSVKSKVSKASKVSKPKTPPPGSVSGRANSFTSKKKGPTSLMDRAIANKAVAKKPRQKTGKRDKHQQN